MDEFGKGQWIRDKETDILKSAALTRSPQISEGLCKNAALSGGFKMNNQNNQNQNNQSQNQNRQNQSQNRNNQNQSQNQSQNRSSK